MVIPVPPVLTESFMTKGQIYDFLIQKLINAGWQDVASNPASEGNIMFSPGEAGDTEIFIQFLPYRMDYTPESADVRYTDKIHISARLGAGYVPGAPGVSGTWDFVSYAFSYVYIYKNPLEASAPNCIVYSYADKDYAVFIIRPPTVATLDSLVGNFIVTGLPKDGLGSRSGARDTFLLTLPFVNYNPGSGTYIVGVPANSALFVNNPVEMPTAVTSQLHPVCAYGCFPLVPIRYTDWKNRIIPTVAVMGDRITGGEAPTGARALVTGVYPIDSSASNYAVEGDFILDPFTGYKYKIFKFTSFGAYSQFGFTGTFFIAARVE
jgi:hypothetical protein